VYNHTIKQKIKPTKFMVDV